MKRLYTKTQIFSLNSQILLFVIGLLIFSCILVGIPSYIIAKDQLDQKGKTTLKNAVVMAMMLIETKNEDVLNGTKNLENAQEEVKNYLIGPMNADGTRTILHTIDLGENGYFIVYDLEGNEVLHPTLEGTNVWHVTAPNDPNRYIVQEQIEVASKGGGFLDYPWHYPHEDGYGDKLSYSYLEPHWNWVVVATAYTKDFNAAADSILAVTFISSIILIIIGIAVSIEYIHSITHPLQAMTVAMRESEEGIFQPLPLTHRKDELGVLFNGYNAMVNSLQSIYQTLIDRETKISHYAYFDTMTGLPNKNKMKEIVDNAITTGINHGFLIILDVKNFKTINSIYGTAYGDQVIALIGHLLLDLSNDTTYLGRHTGTEFVGWLESNSFGALKNKSAEFMKRLKQSFIDNKMDINLDFVTCYTTFPKDGTSYEELLQKCIIAISHCKMKAITELTSYDAFMYKSIEQEAAITNQAINGLLEGEFKLYYQSKVDTITHEIIGFEALARWFSKDLGSVSPVIFIPIFSRSNLITDFSEFVVRQALDDLPLLKLKHGNDINVSINISPIFFAKAHFVDFLINEVRLRELSASDITLEITEDILISDTAHMRSKIDQLRRIGFKVSLDDFGTGYSSLNYLRNMPLDEIKIDKSFIDHLIDDPKARALLKSIITIAAAFNCSVVAEGVETEAQAKLVTDAGCDLIQGYLFSKPSPL